MSCHRSIGAVSLLLIASCSTTTRTSEWDAARLLAFTAETCAGWQTTSAPASGFAAAPAESSPIVASGREIGTRFRLQAADGASLELEAIENAGRAHRFIGSYSRPTRKPRLLIVLDGECSQQLARRIDYAADGLALRIVTLDNNLAPRGEPEWLNPPLPAIAAGVGSDAETGPASPPRVGLVDSGVNYLLPEIRSRLAVDRSGALIGYDFWDLDALPFDAHPMRSEFFVQRHGTRTASLLLREAPGVELVPYRYPRPDMTRMRDLVEHAARNGVSILGLPLGGNTAEEWDSFAGAVADHPRMLFVASAGNNGRDIDRQPVYPAALDLPNLLVVTSADDFVQPAERVNWGRNSVDYLLPAERIPVTDFSGDRIQASGSSYAVPRLVALAARLRAVNPDWGAPEIIAELERRYRDLAAQDWVGIGYIPDPLAGAPVRFGALDPPALISTPGEDSLLLSLDLLLLDARWDRERYATALRQAFDILAQCGIAAGDISLRELRGPDYLRDLSTGRAHTLLTAAAGRHATVVFARDTRMEFQYTGEAFGRGNTSRRPWLRNSVWLMLDVDDAGIALAHELFHVLANSGAHVEDGPNLMQPRTRPESTDLTDAQCALARSVGEAAGLLRRID